MADIELVIKIPKELINQLDDDNYPSIISWFETTLYCAIKNGIPLPKGYGDLIDRNELLKQPLDNVNYPSNYVRIAPTIIPATKEEKQIKKYCYTCKWDYSNFKEYADEATKLAHCRNCKQASGHEPMKVGRQTVTKEGDGK